MNTNHQTSGEAPMERTPVMNAPQSRQVRHAEPTPAPSAPLLRLNWWLVGAALAMTSLAIAAYSIAPNIPTFANVPGPDGKMANLGERRAVAIAYVDVEGGVRKLNPTTPGRITTIPKPVDSVVKQGDLLLQIDDSLQIERLTEAKIDLKAAQERLSMAKAKATEKEKMIEAQIASVNAAKKRHEAAIAATAKVQRLYQKDLGGSAEDVQAARKVAEEALAGIKAEEAKVEVVRAMDVESAVRLAQIEIEAKTAQLSKAELAVRECKLTAPCDGQILRIWVHVGEVFGASGPVPAIEFSPAGAKMVRAEVEQEFASAVKVGMKATITDDTTKSDAWTGKVVRLSNWFSQRRSILVEPMQFNDMRTMEAIIELDAAGQKALRVNQRVRVQMAE
jgi:multidrug resistance efflux pump